MQLFQSTSTRYHHSYIPCRHNDLSVLPRAARLVFPSFHSSTTFTNFTNLTSLIPAPRLQLNMIDNENTKRNEVFKNERLCQRMNESRKRRRHSNGHRSPGFHSIYQLACLSVCPWGKSDLISSSQSCHFSNPLPAYVMIMTRKQGERFQSKQPKSGRGKKKKKKEYCSVWPRKIINNRKKEKKKRANPTIITKELCEVWYAIECRMVSSCFRRQCRVEKRQISSCTILAHNSFFSLLSVLLYPSLLPPV